MRIIDKRYKVEFPYAGYTQDNMFNESGGKLVDPRISVSYFKGEQPDASKLTTIDEVIELIKTFAYNPDSVKIVEINGSPVSYYNNIAARNIISGFSDRLDSFIREESFKYFDEILCPMMVENGWKLSSSHVGIPVIIEKDENDEWDNVRGELGNDFEFLCKKFINQFGERTDFPIGCFFKYIEQVVLDDRGLYIKLD